MLISFPNQNYFSQKLIVIGGVILYIEALSVLIRTNKNLQKIVLVSFRNFWVLV